jgi:hypothetical protein
MAQCPSEPDGGSAVTAELVRALWTEVLIGGLPLVGRAIATRTPTCTACSWRAPPQQKTYRKLIDVAIG